MSFFMRHLASYCVRVGSLNVGIMTGRKGSLVDMIETRTVGVLCVSKRIDGRGTKRNGWGRLQVAAGRVIQW